MKRFLICAVMCIAVLSGIFYLVFYYNPTIKSIAKMAVNIANIDLHRENMI